MSHYCNLQLTPHQNYVIQNVELKVNHTSFAIIYMGLHIMHTLKYIYIINY